MTQPRIIRAAFALFALFVATLVTAPVHAEKRVALIIGNSAYKNVTRLDNPKNDAALMAETLRGLGFTLVGGGAQFDLDKFATDRAVQNFSDAVRGGDVGLFYYAGHGVQVRGTNYLVPVDANPTRETDVDFQMLDTNLVLRQMEGAGTKLNVVILDACRNNPFGGRGLRASDGGLAQMRAPEGTLISFATQPGNVAKDGFDGNSPYTKALAQTIKRPGLDIFRTFNEVGLTVMRATGNAQQPWLSSSPISGEFYFAGERRPDAPAAAAEPKEARLTTPAADPLRRDLLTDCDRLAGYPSDTQRASGVAGVSGADRIDGVNAQAACNEAMRQYPDVARFVAQTARVAYARKDYETARQLYEKATGMGSKVAMHGLGYLYIFGLGVPQDQTLGRQWFEKAAAAGEPMAMAAVGVIYQDGLGVPQDYTQARQWFEKAAAAGDPGAMNNLGHLYRSGLGVPPDHTQARQWYEKAAAGGNSKAMVNLGFLYEYGWGVSKDLAQARQWYEKSAAAGNEEAKNNLRGLDQKK